VIIFGVDPGTARMGFGVIDYDHDSRLINHGVLETPARSSMPDRLHTLYDHVCDLLDDHRPAVLAVEQLFFARNVTTAISVGQARGVVLLAAAQRDIPVQEFTPSEIKQAIVGYGKADKAQIQEMVRMILNLESIPQPDDAADAIAVAICYAHHATGYGSLMETGQ
jgi:crossover junction endodeoxyribonuclease RuvC